MDRGYRRRQPAGLPASIYAACRKAASSRIRPRRPSALDSIWRTRLGAMPSCRPISRSGSVRLRRSRSAARPRSAHGPAAPVALACNVSSRSDTCTTSSGAGPSDGSRSPNRVLALAQRPIQPGHRPRGVAQRQQVLQRDLGLLGDLLVGRRAIELQSQRVLRARDLALGADEVDRELDRARLGVHPALDGLADRPRRVRASTCRLAPVELLDRADQAEDAFLDQVQHRSSEPWHFFAIETTAAGWR